MDENVTFRSIEINPPNVPRPIEKFLGCLAQKVYEGGWEAKTEQHLILGIESNMKEFDKLCGEPFRGVKAKVKSIGDNGVYAYLNKIFYLEINSLFRGKNRKSLSCFFFFL